jgi:hypothetical protein
LIDALELRYNRRREESAMSTTQFNITVDVDIDGMMESAKIIMGPGPYDGIEERVSEAIKRAIKDNVPHVLGIRDFDTRDC